MPTLGSEGDKDRKLQYAIWRGLPKYLRGDDEKTLVALAKKLNIRPQSISRWNKDPEVIAISESAIKVLGEKHVFEVIDAIVAGAKKGNPAMARLYMEWQGQIGTRISDNKAPKEVKVTFITQEAKKLKVETEQTSLVEGGDFIGRG